MSRKSKIVALAVGSAVLMSLLGLSPAQARGHDEPATNEDSSQAPLVAGQQVGSPDKSDGLSSQSLKLGASPAGCYGQTDYAHKSTVYASVHGRTRCSFPVASVGVTTTLQKQGWFYWENMMSETSSRTNSATSYDAHPHWGCSGWGSQNYRGLSSHWSVEGSTRYSATTVGGEARFTC